MDSIYFDNAATTQISDEVIQSMTKVMTEYYGNPSSIHAYGRSSKSIIENSRKTIAKHFNALPQEIVFTSGGTEADNLILQSAVKDLGVTEIITSRIEHHAVLHTIEALKNEHQIAVKFVKLQDCGTPDYNDLERLLKANSNLKLVSLMHVNNEIGNILDIKCVANLCQENEALFHSDTVQSIGHYNLDVQDIAIDFMAASAHKFHGPKGVGFAFIRKHSRIKPLLLGGSQERGFRAGTEAIHNIKGLETAVVLAYTNLEKDKVYIQSIKDYFIAELKQIIPNVIFNGNSEYDTSTYTSVNVCLPMSTEKASLLQFQLDLKGIACSKGSACQSGSSQNSHVLTELLSAEDLLKPSVRFSFSKYNTNDEVDYVIGVLKDVVDN